MQPLTIVLSVVLAGVPTGVRARSPRPAPSAVLSRCLVSLLDEAEVPAQEAGVLLTVRAREGQPVAEGDVLAQIDDAPAKIDRRVAELQLAVAQEKADNDINVRYARAAADVAKAEYESAVESNRKFPGTVPRTQVDRLRLTWRRSTLQIEQSQHDLKISELEARVRQAELEAAQARVARRQIRSPLEGEVVKCYRHAGEWVKPGDRVFHVVRMDRLRIEGFLSQSQYAPWQVKGQPVQVKVRLAGGRPAQFTGRIYFVSPLVQAGGEYRICAEVVNRKPEGDWLLRAGQLAEMTIQLKDSHDADQAERITSRSAPR